MISSSFADESFASLSGARIVRIATNPDYTAMGYGSKAIHLLQDYYERKYINLAETETREPTKMTHLTDADLEGSSLLVDDIKVRDINTMPPLFSKLSECTPVQLDYIGVSFGLNQRLHKFWKRAGYIPLYLRQTANEYDSSHNPLPMFKSLKGF